MTKSFPLFPGDLKTTYSLVYIYTHIYTYNSWIHHNSEVNKTLGWRRNVFKKPQPGPVAPGSTMTWWLRISTVNKDSSFIKIHLKCWTFRVNRVRTERRGRCSHLRPFMFRRWSVGVCFRTESETNDEPFPSWPTSQPELGPKVVIKIWNHTNSLVLSVPPPPLPLPLSLRLLCNRRHRVFLTFTCCRVQVRRSRAGAGLQEEGGACEHPPPVLSSHSSSLRKSSRWYHTQPAVKRNMIQSCKYDTWKCININKCNINTHVV